MAARALFAGDRRPAAAPFGIENFLVCLVNLTGKPLPPETVNEYCPGSLPITAGKDTNSHVAKAGCVVLIGGAAVWQGTGVPTLVLLFPPQADAETKYHKMHAACMTLEQRYPQTLTGKVLVAPSVDEWKAVVSSLAAQLLPPPPTYTTYIPKSRRRRRRQGSRQAGAACSGGLIEQQCWQRHAGAYCQL